MTPDEYRARAQAIAATAASEVAFMFQMLPPDPSDEVWRRFIQQAYEPVMRARLEIFRLSQDYYLSQRPATAPGAVEFIERGYPQRVLSRALSRPRARLSGVDALEAEDRRLAADEVQAVVTRHAAASGRDAVQDAARNDPAALGWARAPSGAETCAFCTMLVSRGPVYKDERAAGERLNGEPYHNRCDCVPVPVFSRDEWPGREDYLEAERLWRDVTSGYSGDDALNALRRHLDAA